MIRDYKVGSRNSTVCGYPGRDFDWSLFDWEGKAIYKSIFKGCDDMKALRPYIDTFLIAPNCEYLHVPYNFAEQGTVYRVRPNDSMYAGRVYRGRLVTKQEAIEKADGWYWQLTTESLDGVEHRGTP